MTRANNQKSEEDVMECAVTNVTEGNDGRIITILGIKYYRSDLAAEMMHMHKNTLLEKARQGKIRKYHHNHAVWFRESWMLSSMR